MLLGHRQCVATEPHWPSQKKAHRTDTKQRAGSQAHACSRRVVSGLVQPERLRVLQGQGFWKPDAGVMDAACHHFVVWRAVSQGQAWQCAGGEKNHLLHHSLIFSCVTQNSVC